MYIIVAVSPTLAKRIFALLATFDLKVYEPPEATVVNNILICPVAPFGIVISAAVPPTLNYVVGVDISTIPPDDNV